MTSREEEGASLLSNISSDVGSMQDDEKLTVTPTSASSRESITRSLSSALIHVSRFRATSRLIRNLIALTAAILVFGLLFVHGPRLPTKLPHPFSNKAADRLERPKDTKIVGLVFFGRRDRASILDCYLKNNLLSSGGWLDEVVWGVNTDNTNDLAYLDKLLPTTPAYRKVELADRSYFGLWNESVEAGNIYVKLDDDVVYIDDDAIPLIVDTLVTNAESVIVSANTVNSPELNWVQYRTGAILSHLPDLNYARSADLSTIENPKWRASELPDWIEPADFKVPLSRDDWNDYIKRLIPRPKVLNESEHGSRELPFHRWLPVRGSGAIQKTPIAQTENGAFGGGWWSWAIAAQQHYSFFDNLEHNRKNAYFLGHGSTSKSDAIWDNTGDRISINFLALRGETILDNLDKMQANGNDEVYLSEQLPKQLKKREYSHPIEKAGAFQYYSRPEALTLIQACLYTPKLWPHITHSAHKVPSMLQTYLDDTVHTQSRTSAPGGSLTRLRRLDSTQRAF